VEYYDLADLETRQKLGHVVDEITKRRLRMPVVAIDGEFVESGRVDYWDIARQVEKKLRPQN
jgi:disulfide oxidoreductase YuzD